jgi:DNA-binding transcriptional ArsR family regulator
MPISAYTACVARAATTSDAFNAIAESDRRRILEALINGEVAVGELVERLHLNQPQVSKHLAVLRSVDLVHYRTTGRQKLYRLNAEALRPIHEWTSSFEWLWNARLDRLDDLLTELQQTVPATASVRKSRNDTKQLKERLL